ncbi:four-carbon acid sugar kinase family protein [Deinococcus radiomollis]|uniref:four-carbon acid sugar kinase family protein n=1 Tax=Deinococcus radiomollis TaxID=468916 RepID=UPI0038923BB9
MNTARPALPGSGPETPEVLPPDWLTDLPESEAALLAQVRSRASGRRLVVLDDDPTGMQTLYGIPVLLQWDGDEIRDALAGNWPAVYILTNSRSMDAAGAEQTVRGVMRKLVTVAGELGLELRVVSRSDSTLRGHFPLETDVMAEELGSVTPIAGTVLVPAFIEGGRVTHGGVHYLLEGGRPVPLGETEFARDPAFQYASSSLPEWVEEKTGGRTLAAEVRVLPLALLRNGGSQAVAEWLEGLPVPFVAAADAVCQRDLEVLALGALIAEERGVNVLFRTAASMVRALAGLESRSLLPLSTLLSPRSQAGGLCVVGSFISRSSEQLSGLLALPGVQPVELDVNRILDGAALEEVERAANLVNAHLSAGHGAVLYTSRRVRTGASADLSLDIGRAVSGALTDVVQRLSTEPGFLIAKGGITSHNVAFRGLGAHTALVLGQAISGVPVWELGPETPFPGLPYVVFPGNVGGPSSLGELYAGLQAELGRRRAAQGGQP